MGEMAVNFCTTGEGFASCVRNGLAPRGTESCEPLSSPDESKTRNAPQRKNRDCEGLTQATTKFEPHDIDTTRRKKVGALCKSAR